MTGVLQSELLCVFMLQRTKNRLTFIEQLQLLFHVYIKKQNNSERIFAIIYLKRSQEKKSSASISVAEEDYDWLVHVVLHP